jgi:hypothetical protein
MPDLSIAYGKLIAALGTAQAVEIGEALLKATGAHYESTAGDCELLLFTHGSARFLFDLASSRGLARVDRTVAAYAATPDSVAARDASYQRGFPMKPASATEPVDRGHLIPRLSGGEYGPNIFRQDRALNRGWSEEGKQLRELERRAQPRLGRSTSGISSIQTTRTTRPS